MDGSIQDRNSIEYINYEAVTHELTFQHYRKSGLLYKLSIETHLCKCTQFIIPCVKSAMYGTFPHPWPNAMQNYANAIKTIFEIATNNIVNRYHLYSQRRKFAVVVSLPVATINRFRFHFN